MIKISFVGYIVATIVVVAVVIFCWYKWGPSGVTPWIELTTMNGLPWGSSPTEDASIILRPWKGKGLGLSEYYGAIKYTQGKRIEMTLPPDDLPSYFEYSIFHYPTWRRAYTIPLSPQAVVGGTNYPLEDGLYCVFLRCTELPSSLADKSKYGVKVVSKSNMIETGPRIEPYSDDPLYPEVEEYLNDIMSEMEGYTIGESYSSERTPLILESPYIRQESMSVDLGVGEKALLIYVDRPSLSSLKIGRDEIESEDTINHAILDSRRRTLTITEIIYGVSPRSEIMPLYLYTLV